MAIPGYKILKKIGDGGMSSVYLAIQLSVGREVALKVLSPELRNEKNFIEKFFREANIVGTLSHPNIVSIYDVGTHDGHYYIAMDHLPGDACAERIRSAEMDLDTALRIIRDIASALDYAHERGFVHCDVKPDNILFRYDGSAVLTDFGIAIATNVASRGAMTGVAGTPHYMSPEQTQGSGIDGRADLYSLGVVFYEMLAHEVPYKGKDAVAVAMKHMTAPIPQLPEHLRDFQPIINRMLAKKPGSRFQTGREVIAALDAITAAQGKSRGRQSTGNSGVFLQSTLSAPVNAISAGRRHVSDVVDLLRRLQLSPRYGLVLQGAGAAAFGGGMSDSEADEQGDTTSFNTTSFHHNLGAALAQNKARRLVAPIWIVLFLLTCVIAVMSLQFSQLFGASFWRQLSGPEIVGLSEPQTPEKIAPAVPQPAKPPTPLSTTMSTATMPTSTTETAPTSATAATQPQIEAQPSANTAVTEKLAADAIDADTNTGAAGNATAAVPPIDAAATAAAAPVVPPKLYHFTISTTPADADIRMLNIKPPYESGMELPAGKYHIEVTKPGYTSHSRWVVIKNKNVEEEVTLAKVVVAPRYVSGQTLQESLGEYGVGPAMIVIAPGSFTMGDDDIENASPTRSIRIEKMFAFGRYEITYDDFLAYTKATGAATPPAEGKNSGNQPVAMVNWQQAIDYARWLSEVTGQRYRLPTEAEWEYAARAGTVKPYYWNSSNAKKRANCSLGCDSEYIHFLSASAAPIGHYSANAWGISDTSGNVAEWVQDCYHPNYVGAPPLSTAWTAGNCAQRVLRGGSFKSKAAAITSASREGADASTQKKFIGFRLVREIAN